MLTLFSLGRAEISFCPGHLWYRVRLSGSAPQVGAVGSLRERRSGAWLLLGLQKQPPLSATELLCSQLPQLLLPLDGQWAKVHFISSLLPMFSATHSAGVYFLNCMNNLLIKQIYLCFLTMYQIPNFLSPVTFPSQVTCAVPSHSPVG